MSDKEDKITSIPSIEDHHYLLFNKDFDPSSCGDAMEFIIARNLMRKDRPKHSYGKEHELMARVKEFNNTHARIVEHYKRCTGLDEKSIKKYLLPAEDVWLTAKEAVKYGIADEIVEFY